MSRFILTLTTQFSDNPFTHLYIKTWKVLCRMHVYKVSIRRHNSSEKDPGALKFVSQ